MSLGMSGRMGMRSLQRDRSILEHRMARGTLRRVVRFARPYYRALEVFLVVVLVDAVVTSVTPLVLRAIIDDGILRHREAVVLGLSGLTVGLALADAGLSLVQRRLSAWIGEGLIFDLRSRVFAHVQDMPIAFFARTQTGALISRLNNDVIGAQQAFTDLLSNVVGNAILVLLTLVAMFVLSWQVTAVALVLVPIFLIPARLVGRRLGGFVRRGMELNAEMNSLMSERFNVAGAMTVKLFGRRSDEVVGFDQRAGAVRDIGVRQATYQRFFLVGLALTASVATAFAYGFGGTQVIRGQLVVGTVVALTAYLSRLYGPLTQLSNLNVDFISAMLSFERIFEVLDLPPHLREPESPVALPPGPLAVEMRDVTFSYPGAEDVSLASLEAVAVLEKATRTEVIRDVSFTVAPGTMTALVGPSGAGKTTLSMLVARLYDVDSGAVEVGGVDVRDLSAADRRAAIGVVTQEAHLFHDTLRANLLYARPDASDDDLEQALRAAHVWPLVSSLPEGLDTLVGERGYRLSGGEKQRVALARLLLKGPRVVVLDEATAHLDAESEVAVQRALDDVMATRTSIVIAHRLATVRGADQILVVDGGRVVARGTHEELMASAGLYRTLYETQFAVGSAHGVGAAVDVQDLGGGGAQQG